MKSFKVRDGKVIVDGVIYSESPSSAIVMGKSGKIHSIRIDNRGQYFPIGGSFIDDSLKVDEVLEKEG
jgi:hypothetical protein